MSLDNVRQLHSNDALPPCDERDWVTSTELRDQADITYRQLDYWTRTGLLIPIHDPTPGSGWLRTFPVSQVERAHAIHQLLEAGMALSTIRDVVDAFVTHGHVQIGAITITRTGAAS